MLSYYAGAACALQPPWTDSPGLNGPDPAHLGNSPCKLWLVSVRGEPWLSHEIPSSISVYEGKVGNTLSCRIETLSHLGQWAMCVLANETDQLC